MLETIRGYAAERLHTDVDAPTVKSLRSENLGYLLAEAAVRTHGAESIATNAAVEIPHPDWMNEARVRKALAESSKRKLLGRR